MTEGAIDERAMTERMLLSELRPPSSEPWMMRVEARSSADARPPTVKTSAAVKASARVNASSDVTPADVTPAVRSGSRSDRDERDARDENQGGGNYERAALHVSPCRSTDDRNVRCAPSIVKAT